MDDEIKKKAAEALRAGADAAKTLGGIACALGQKGYAAAVDKARDLRERARLAKEKAEEKRMEKQRLAEENRSEEQMRVEAERAREMKRLEAERQRTSNRGTPKLPGDPNDKVILISYGWLCFIWWLWNIVFTIISISWFVSATSSYYSKGTAWMPVVFWLLALLFNRLAYEGAVAFFEMVRHLRQIRDELRRHNMREEARDRAAWEARQQAEAPAEADPQNVDGIANEGDNVAPTR